LPVALEISTGLRHIGFNSTNLVWPMSQDLIQFVKMNGLGNEIIVADMRRHKGVVSPQAAIALAGDTGFDQLMAVHAPRSNGDDAFIHILNSDGSDAGACGNGMRCVVSWLHRDTPRDVYRFETISGKLDARYFSDTAISVNMGRPRFAWDQIPLAEEFADTRFIELQIGPIDDPVLHTPSVANIGNPHAIFWVNNDPWNYDLERFGPLLENHPIFPDRANITVARITAEDAVSIRTWERGAGITKACGSAACATLVSGARLGRLRRRASVMVPGGELDITWRDDDFIIMTGPVEYEFTGTMDPISGAWFRDNETVIS
jgi:diaminopimelate epimerase